MPSLRGELLSFIEKLDSIANKAEAVSDHFVLYKPAFSKQELQILLDILDVTLKGLEKLQSAYEYLFTDFDQVLPLCREVEDMEGQVDKIEWES